MTALEKLIAEATPMPWRCGLSERDPQKRKANEKLFVHAVNMLPKLVAALEEIERLTTTYSESSLSFGVISKKAAAVLAEANNPEVSK
jgi:glutamate synthase domain-containing protein 2